MYGCPAFSTKYMVHIRWPDEIIRWPEDKIRAPIDVLLGADGSDWSQTYFVRGDARQYVAVDLTADSAGSWVSTSPGLTAPMTSVNASVPVAEVMSLDLGTELPTFPSLMRMEQGADAARWALLRPVQFEGETVRYAIDRTGELSENVGASARLVHDQQGTFVALVSPEQGTVFGYDPKLHDWVPAVVPEEAIEQLADANIALIGSSLFIVGNRTGDEGDVPTWMIDIFGRQPRDLDLALPARQQAQLLLSTDKKAFLLAGGIDSVGQAHDDVWSVPLPTGDSEWQSARRVRPDTAKASNMRAATVFASNSDGSSLRAWSLGAEKHTADIGLDYALELLVSHVFRFINSGNTGVIDQDVDFPELISDRFHHGLYIFAFIDIHPERQCFNPVMNHFPGHFFQLGKGSRGQHQVAAGLGQPAGKTFAQTLGTSGHNCGFTRKVVHVHHTFMHCLFSPWLIIINLI